LWRGGVGDNYTHGACNKVGVENGDMKFGDESTASRKIERNSCQRRKKKGEGGHLEDSSKHVRLQSEGTVS